MTAPLLDISGLRKHYIVRRGLFGRATVPAVDGVSLQIGRGETLGLVGESGCGKSTLARTLVQLERPDSGQITFDGRPLTSLEPDEARSQIQIIFQDPYTSLPPKMSIRRIIAEPLLIHRRAKGEELQHRVDELLTDVGLPIEVGRLRPGQLSGGQRQRAGIARALALRPSLLIADEAVSALDVSVQAQILNLLMSLQRRLDLTLLFISHDISVVTCLSQRIAVMYLGQIVEVGPAQQVYSNPLHPYTRALMAAVPGLAKRHRARTDVRGEPPDPKEPPRGCRFHPRCPMAQQICHATPPSLDEWLPDRMAACHFALEGTTVETTPNQRGSVR